MVPGKSQRHMGVYFGGGGLACKRNRKAIKCNREATGEMESAQALVSTVEGTAQRPHSGPIIRFMFDSLLYTFVRGSSYAWTLRSQEEPRRERQKQGRELVTIY